VKGISNPHTDCNSDANGNSNRDADCHAKSYSDTKAAPDSTTTSDSAAVKTTVISGQ
jgi:hypothetical protein